MTAVKIILKEVRVCSSSSYSLMGIPLIAYMATVRSRRRLKISSRGALRIVFMYCPRVELRMMLLSVILRAGMRKTQEMSQWKTNCFLSYFVVQS